MARRGRGRPAHPDVLTPAEWTILDLWRHGLGRTAIAQRRGVSDYAVRYHLRNIVDKLGVDSFADLRQWPGFPVTSAMARRASTPLANPSPHFDRRSSAMPNTESAPTLPTLQLGELGQVSMYARDAATTEAWYRDVLQLPEVFRFGDLVFFWCGDVRLYIHAVGEEKWRPSSVLYFVVPDIHGAHDELVRRGIKITGAPHMIFKDDKTGVEEWMAFFEDPDTNMLAIMARVTPS
jgi:DNA-binding CsgD family transcriptional regulator/catechol 2,3-dioxygenase-like lactoylglutathione lyase family enzyme